MKNGDYLLIIAPKEYIGKKYREKYCYEHHYIYWKNTGLIPNKNQLIHHKNENRYDNRFENLELIYKKDHPQKHPQKVKESNLHICVGCGIKFHRTTSDKYKKSNIFFHSRECYIKHHNLSPGGVRTESKIINLIKSELKEGLNGSQISKKYGLNRKTVYNIIKTFIDS